jgi:hypothetical protein
MPVDLDLVTKFHEEFDQLDRFSHAPGSSTGSRIGAMLKQQSHRGKVSMLVVEAGSHVCSGG